MKSTILEIRLNQILLAAFAFAPLLVNIVLIYPDFCNYNGRIHLALFCIYSCILFFCLYFLSQKNRPLYLGLVILFCVYSALNLAYLFLVGNPITYTAYASVLETNIQEAIEFVTSAFFLRYVSIVVGLLLGTLSISRVRYALHIKRNGLVIRMLKGSVTVGWLFCVAIIYAYSGKLVDYYPVYEIAAQFTYMKEVHSFVSAYSKLDYVFKGTIDSTSRTTVVLVIGEGARRDAHGIYDDRLATNSRLSAAIFDRPDRFAVFEDAISASDNTRASLPSMLSVTTSEDISLVMSEPSIIKIISAAGLESTLLTNHKRRGSYNDFISTMFKDATRKRYLASDESGKYYDACLVPLLEEELNRPTNSARLIVLHLYGSHYGYDSRYPTSHIVYDEGTERGKYLNSVAYSDHVLGMLLDLIFTSEKETVFLYVSDHGEILNDYGDDYFGHGFKKLPKSRSEFEVPFVIAFNDAFLERYDSSASRIKAQTLQPVSHDNISHTVLGLLGIRAEEYQPTYDLSSSQFTTHDRYTIFDLFDTYSYSDSSSYIPRVENIFAEIPLAADSKLIEGTDPLRNSHQ